MLYNLYETQRSLMEPFAELAQTVSKIYSNPVSPFSHTTYAQRMSAGYDLLYRLGKDYEKPVFGISTVQVDGHEVVIHERVELDKLPSASCAASSASATTPPRSRPSSASPPC